MELLQLTSITRNDAPFAKSIAIDVSDIVRPIEEDGGNSIIYVNEGKPSNREYEIFDQVKYVVSEALSVIEPQSPRLINLTVESIGGRAKNPFESMLFNADEIAGVITPSGSGSFFRYKVQGQPRLEEYVVSESPSAIVGLTVAGSAFLPFVHSKTLFVDPSGNDTTAQKGSLVYLYQTITAAKTAAVSGETIVVFPGTYSDTDLLKNGVDYYFYEGAEVIAAGTIIGDSAGAASANIDGDGYFEGTGASGRGIDLTNSSSIKVKCRGIAGDERAIQLASSAVLDLKCNEVVSNGDYGINITGTGLFHAKIFSLSAGEAAIRFHTAFSGRSVIDIKERIDHNYDNDAVVYIDAAAGADITINANINDTQASPQGASLESAFVHLGGTVRFNGRISASGKRAYLNTGTVTGEFFGNGDFVSNAKEGVYVGGSAIVTRINGKVESTTGSQAVAIGRTDEGTDQTSGNELHIEGEVRAPAVTAHGIEKVGTASSDTKLVIGTLKIIAGTTSGEAITASNTQDIIAPVPFVSNRDVNANINNLAPVNQFSFGTIE